MSHSLICVGVIIFLMALVVNGFYLPGLVATNFCAKEVKMTVKDANCKVCCHCLGW